MTTIGVPRENVQRIDGAGIIVVQPRRENAQATKLAAVLVREDVVRVIRSGPVILKWTERRSGNVLAGHRAIGTVLGLVNPLQDYIKVRLCQGPLAAGVVRHLCFVVDQRGARD